MTGYVINAEESLKRLKEGNQKFLKARTNDGDISIDRRINSYKNGQQPYAIIVTCSDSRVVPEAIFNAGIGDLFVIRVAGFVMDDHQLGSIEYAAEHLGCGLVLVLGHNHCGAVDAAINHDPDGYVRFITDEILKAIGEETDDYKACCLNVKHSCQIIESSIQIQRDEHDYGLKVMGALYHLENGEVEFFNT